MLSVLISVFICQLIQGVYWFYSTVTKGSFFFFTKVALFPKWLALTCYILLRMCVCVWLCVLDILLSAIE